MSNPRRRLNNPRRSVVVFEDDLNKLVKVADRAIVLRAGHVPKEIAERELDVAISYLVAEGD